MPPRVGVVMCVHDGWPYLPEAVESVLAQTCPVDRFVIVDDASTDEGVNYLAGLSDPRLLLVRNSVRSGPGSAAQRGVEACDCELVARLDADDIAEPWRIRVQTAYMESHPGVVMACTSARLIDESGRSTGTYEAPRPTVLEWELVFRNPVVQSTVMFRTGAFHAAGGYADMQVGEDYDLWSRLLRSGAQLGSIPMSCVRLRKHGSQVSERRREEMFEAAAGIASCNIEALMDRQPGQGCVRVLAGAGAEDPADTNDAIVLLTEITDAYLAQHRAGPSARREISLRVLVRAREIALTAALARADRRRALRLCISSGALGLATVRGARAAARLLLTGPTR